MSPTITFSQFSSHQLTIGACSFYPQGMKAVVHGWLFVHWTTILVKSREKTFNSLLGGEIRVKGNTPDFILKHFIVLFSDVTQAALTL